MVWYQLKMACPVQGCPNQFTAPFNWVCRDDQNTMYICEQGRLKCSTGAHDAQVVNWRFACGSYGGGHKSSYYAKTDMASFTYAIGMAVPLLAQAGLQWFKTLIDNLEDQFEN